MYKNKASRVVALIGISLSIAFGHTVAHAQSDKVFNIRLGHTGSPEHHFQKISERYAQLVDERTGGHVKIKVYPSDSLGKQVELVEGTFIGTNDMVLTSDAVLSNTVREAGMINLPFLFRDSDHVRKVLDGEIGAALSKKVEAQGAVVVGWWENGFRHITNSKQPITKPEDLKGMKIRVPEGPIFVETFRSLGANATPIAFTELYSALQLGVIDGQENPPAHILTQKFYEVQKFASRTGHIYLSSPVLINKGLLEQLPAEYQEVLLKTGNELAAVHTKMVLDEEASQWQQIEEMGMQVNDVDKAPFVEATAPVIAKYREVFGPDLIDAVVKTN
ncbi:TRAP transporter substrate-binding protein [Stutzerimonas stutzeri]|uniref:DctP family TRAP transporter solute-binding subunit n=1 Tax=Stutzerimonas stutzeri TaxID=316 RepID=A0A6I6LUF5_STUST|nr:TRAP transporter substrate-binding protein [Stutzerimonas stutzeri]QGZ30322.1 DctP family TRAP transporter solute-binding subunit [Stutzerimonas stutzeri]